MSRKIHGFLATFIVILLLVAGALAGNTAPYTLSEEENAQISTHEKGRIQFGQLLERYHGISVPRTWVYQAKVDGVPLKLQLFEKNGTGVTFKERLMKASEGEGIALVLRQSDSKGGLLLQMDQQALDVLGRIGITELSVIDAEGYLQETYSISLLNQVREMLELREGEELSVSGLEDPVSVVDESGIRRVISE